LLLRYRGRQLTSRGQLTHLYSIDTEESLHHDADMRTTIDLPDELHHVIASLAARNRKSLSHTAVKLIRRGLEGPLPRDPSTDSMLGTSSVTGLPLVRFPCVVTPEDVRALDDET
jgi:hypothetical protein